MPAGPALPGRKILVPGNHDHRHMALLETVFDEILPPLADVRLQIPSGFEGTWNGWVALCHYPLAVWNGTYRGALHFYGHVHGRMLDEDRRLDVGVDNWNYAPVRKVAHLAGQTTETFLRRPALCRRRGKAMKGLFKLAAATLLVCLSLLGTAVHPLDAEARQETEAEVEATIQRALDGDAEAQLKVGVSIQSPPCQPPLPAGGRAKRSAGR